MTLLLTACGPSQRGEPGSTSIFINEVVASNHHSCTDETGGSADWVELYNASDEDVNLESYVLTDSTDAPTDTTLRLPSVTVQAKSVKVFWADGRPDYGASHLGFQLKSEGERVILYGPDDAMLDRVDWGETPTDVSWGRFPDGEGVFVQCAVPTCRALNGAACAQ